LASHPVTSAPSSDVDRDARLAFLRLDDAAAARLRALQATVQGELPRIAADFYAFIRKWPNLAQLLGSEANIERLRTTQAAHWNGLFSGQFDERYFAQALAIGTAHERIGLEPRWYVGGYCLILEKLVAAIAAKYRAKPGLAEDIAAVLKAAFLDLDLAISTYIQRGEATSIKREMLAVAEVIDRELQLAVGGISTQTESLSEGADRMSTTAEHMRTMADALSASVKTTAESVQTIASATEEMSASTREIAAQVGTASSASASAVSQATATTEAVQALTAATGKINDIVKLVGSIAAQTKLLALNATIEAARAGEAGKGFAVVASEVKSLARQTEEAIRNVSAQADAIGRATEQASEMVGGIARHIGSVNAIAQEVSSATDQQRHTTEEISASIGNAAQHSQTVAGKAHELLSEADKTKDTASHFKGLAELVSTGVRDLQQRMTTILRSSQAGDRRRHERETVTLRYKFHDGTRSVDGHTIDLSLGGALLGAELREDLAGRVVSVELENVGTLRAKIVGISPLGIHVMFVDGVEQHHGRIAGVIAESKRLDETYIAKCRDTARHVSEAYARAVAAGRATMNALFDHSYRAIPGTNPQQHSAASLPIAETLLPAILDGIKDADRRIAFCLATDANGYVPVHNREYSQPQRADDPVWNTANSRNKRIFDDRAGILAARSQRPWLVQAYRRDLGGGRFVTLKEFDAPIVLDGRHWGAIRLAVTP
jgi:methyl-accepting chemotaxis protein